MNEYRVNAEQDPIRGGKVNTENFVYYVQVIQITESSALKRERIVAIVDTGVYKEHMDLQCPACNLPLVKEGGNFVRDRQGGMYTHNFN